MSAETLAPVAEVAPVLFCQTAVDPSGVALNAPDGSRTWGDLERDARRFAAALSAHGLRSGDRFGLLGRNSIAYATAILGNAIAGTSYVPLNWHLNVPEMAYLLQDSGARLLVVGAADEASGRSAAIAAGIDDVIVIADGWLDTFGDETFDAHRPVGVPLLYTGGTTGRSKGVERSDLATDVTQWIGTTTAWSGYVGLPAGGTCLITTPLYHAFGYAVLTAALATGNRVVLHDHFDPEEVLATIERERVTAVPLVPTQIVRLVKLDPASRARFDLSSLQWILHTAAPCPAWAKRVLIDWLGPIVVEMYGSSEGGGPVVCSSAEWLARPGTIGRPAPVVEVSVVGDDGLDVPRGEIGTLYFRRRAGAPSYHGDDAKTAANRLTDGRFTVGDLGWIDDDGYLYLADRRVDLILSGGVNVYPAEIEAVLIQHPAVQDAAVFGIPDPDWGQQIKAVVALEADATDAELIAWCRRELAAFKCPRSVDIVDALPREASGKLKKRLLCDPYWADAASA